MTLAAIKRRFVAGRIVTVTNHYITRADHPCFGTRSRTIARVSGSHVYFTETGSIEWPKAAQVSADGDTVRFYGGGAGQQPADLFLTITFMRDYICPDGPSCPDPACRREREARGFPVAPPVVNVRDCAHNTMIANDDPLFAWKCADCGRIYGDKQCVRT